MAWDDDASGVLEADEIIHPLISLGLAPNAQFAIKLLQALDHRQKSKDPSELNITLADFIKIFRTSKASEALLSLVQRETEKRLKPAPQQQANNYARTPTLRDRR